MKKMSLELFLKKESQTEQIKEVNYKLVEVKENDEKADVDQEEKCSTRQELNDRKTYL